MMKITASKNKGFAVLMSVLILAAVGVAISTSLLVLSITGTQTASTTQESQQAKALANACAELSLQKLVTSVVFVGTGNLSLGQGSCTYTIAQLDTLNDVIKVTGTVNGTVRKVQIKITLASLSIVYWQEVGDFF